ncbi:MAG: c-type cytochrome [Erythrobacter sp.]|uniref:c-type cytochrome n=1 Tax=Erythrobacter sp. TaxID=1042 RepID=UPI0032659F83
MWIEWSLNTIMVRKFKLTAPVSLFLCLATTACSNAATQDDGSNSDVDDQAAQTANIVGDATAGKIAFQQCQSCHSIESGKHLLGPSLAGIVGAPAGKSPGFNHSPAGIASEIVWTKDNLDKFLTRPTSVIPGTMMAFPGVADPQARANIITYLESPE